mmetsp:Transcript_10796/g.31243  ORF Transcript_10796/g.31243 Transcript_10796/m.31243 type:complete len:473 (+) Transcript_10796:278-1696(+)
MSDRTRALLHRFSASAPAHKRTTTSSSSQQQHKGKGAGAGKAKTAPAAGRSPPVPPVQHTQRSSRRNSSAAANAANDAMDVCVVEEDDRERSDRANRADRNRVVAKRSGAGAGIGVGVLKKVSSPSEDSTQANGKSTQGGSDREVCRGEASEDLGMDDCCEGEDQEGLLSVDETNKQKIDHIRKMRRQLGMNYFVNVNENPVWPPIKKNKFTTRSGRTRNPLPPPPPPKPRQSGKPSGGGGGGDSSGNSKGLRRSARQRGEEAEVVDDSKKRESDESEATTSKKRRASLKSYKGLEEIEKKLATLCDGVYTKRSTLGRHAGLGLYADRFFAKNSIITEFVGYIIDRDEAMRLRRERKATHIADIEKPFFYIDGEKEPKPFIGGGSFANDGSQTKETPQGRMPPPGNNSKFFKMFDHKQGRTRLFIKALQDIHPAEEIFVGYSRDYWIDVEEEDNSSEEERRREEKRKKRRNQ